MEYTSYITKGFTNLIGWNHPSPALIARMESVRYHRTQDAQEPKKNKKNAHIDKEKKMLRSEAINFLKSEGWDDIGAKEIVDTYIEHYESLSPQGSPSLTYEALKSVSEIYKDR